MQTFPSDRVDDIVRYVIERGCNLTVQEEDTGHALSVFEDLSDSDKATIVKQFCNRHVGPYKVYSVQQC